MQSYMQYETALGTVARWHGGAYIELGHMDHKTGAFIAFDVINVWEYEASEPLIPRTLEAFQARVDQHIAQYAEDC